jgi:hypothetical protein
MPGPQAFYALIGTNILLLAARAWTSAQSQAPATDVIRARLIELVNERGEMRAQLHLTENGGGELTLRNGAGEIRLKLGTTNDGVGLLMVDPSTQVGAHLVTSRSGPSLTLTDPQKGKTVVAP